MRRQAVLAAAAACLVVASGLIVVGGKAIKARQPSIAAEDLTAAVEAAGLDRETADLETSDPVAADPEPVVAQSDPADADDAAPLERVAPRGALSELGQALPPKPVPPGEWKGTRLPQPVATAAGLVEAKGYRVAVAGIDPVPVEEMCSYQGRDWACGVRARAAFRAFLRGRAITCVVPPEAEPEIVTAACTLGKQDVAAWLATNGWAPASAGGDYAALGEAAKSAGKGIFGPPPETTAPSSILSDSELPPPPDGGSILAAPQVDDLPGGAVVPAPVITPGEVFPPAPPPAPAQ